MQDLVEKKWIVYIHKSPNNKFYVGITSQKPNNRWRNGWGYIRSNCNDHFTNAIKKYGWNNFEHIIYAENLSKYEAGNLEQKLISILRSNDRRFGYNKESGGFCNKHMHEEAKEKLSKSQPKYFGKDNHESKPVICLNNLKIFDCVSDANRWVGYREDSSLISNFLQGTTNCKSMGKHPETGERLNWAYYDENKTYVITPPPDRSHNKKSQRVKVVCLDTKEIYNSFKSAIKHTKNSYWDIRLSCENKETRKLHWQYYEDYLKMNNLTDKETENNLFFIA